MIMLWKAVVFEVEVQGLQAHPLKFWFAENLGKSPKNPGRNGVQRRLTAPKVCMKKHEDLFLEVTPKRGLHDLCGRKFVGINCTKTFRASLGKFGQNPLHPKNLPAPTPMMKRHICPRCPLLKGQRGKDPRRTSILRLVCAYYSTRTVFTRCCRLQCVTAMNINYRQSPKTEQFMTAEISGNALKQRSGTHSVLRQRSSQLQKHQAARMSRIATDQKVCGWDGGHPGPY